MSRIALVGCIFVAVLFFVCVGYFISHKPTIPLSSTAIEKTQPASSTSNSSPSTPGATPTPTAAAEVPASAPEPVAPAAPVPSPAPAKIKPLPSPAASAPSGTAYAVDSGSFHDRNNAERLAAAIPQKYQTKITPVTVHGQMFYRVRTIVPTQSDATALAATLAHDQKLQARISPIQQP